MKLNQMLKNAERKVVDFTHNPDKMRGLFTGIAITVVGALLVNEVKDSKHIKEVKNASNHYLEVGIGLGVKSGNLDTLDYLNQLNKISKEEAILYGNQYDDFINYKFEQNDVLLQHFNDSVKDLQEDFESGLN